MAQRSDRDLSYGVSSQPSEVNVEGANDPVDYDATCWKELERELGFHSYLAYMRAYLGNSEKDFELERSLQYGGCKDDDAKYFATGSCSIYDITSAGSLSTALSIQGYVFKRHVTELLQILRDPPPDASVRVVVLHMKNEECWLHLSVIIALINALGLGLRIGPDYFDACLYAEIFGPRRIYERHLKRFLDARHVQIDRSIFTVARDYLPYGRHSPPVVLILGLQSSEEDFANSSEPRFFDKLPLQAQLPTSLEPRRNTYEALLHCRLKTTENIPLDQDAIILHAVMPLLEMYLRHQRASCGIQNVIYLNIVRKKNVHEKDLELSLDNVRFLYEKDLENSLENVRFLTRRMMRDTEQCLSDFRRFRQIQLGSKCLEDDSTADLEQEFSLYLNDARGLEAEIRDWLQIRVGSLALEESKRSIELSNLQIDESKRVKIVTLLAFIYVPLNLATSIFGMNLQQLNHNGQNVWVFVGTACVALIVTGLTWLFIEIRATLITWQESRMPFASFTPREEKGYPLMTRLAMLAFLIRHGYVIWTWKTNAWLGILTNGNYSRPLYHLDGLNLCDYVKKYAYSVESDFWFHNRHVSKSPPGWLREPRWRRLLGFPKHKYSGASSSISMDESVTPRPPSVVPSNSQGPDDETRRDSIEIESQRNVSDKPNEV